MLLQKEQNKYKTVLGNADDWVSEYINNTTLYQKNPEEFSRDQYLRGFRQIVVMLVSGLWTAFETTNNEILLEINPDYDYKNMMMKVRNWTNQDPDNRQALVKDTFIVAH